MQFSKAGGLPQEPFGTGAAIFERRGLSTASVYVAVDGWFLMPLLIPRERMAIERWADTLQGV